MFPETKKTVYERNPLDQVICQLRFPPILRIDSAAPADFQERIRATFPNYSEKEELVMPMPPQPGGEIPIELFRQMLPSRHKNYEFSSEDRHWKVNLTRTFVALSVKRKYTRRSEFREYLSKPLDALNDIYKPAYYSRVGLRYVDIIQRSVLGLDGCDWDVLLNSYALWMLSSPTVKDHVETFESQCEVRLDDASSMARIVMSFVECPGAQPKKEKCLMIDTDFYTTKRTQATEVEKQLDDFHTEGLRLFRWLITDRLHSAMGPKEIDNG